MTRQRRQGEIPGTEPKRDDELDAAASNVYELTAERQEVHEREKLARGRLIEMMKKKKVEVYAFIDGEQRFDVKLEESERVSVRKAKQAAAAE